MANNYGIILCDLSRKDAANSIGRALMAYNTTVKVWQRHYYDWDVANNRLAAVTTGSVSTTTACDGSFTGHVIIMMHGNYNTSNTTGLLYLQDSQDDYHEVSSTIRDAVNGFSYGGNAKKVYIHACGQGRQAILDWWKGSSGFNTTNVWSPCTGAMMAGSIDKNDIKTKLGL